MTNTPVVIQLPDMLAELKREIALRRHVYPRWVASGKFTQAKADRQIAILEAIVAELTPRETKERLL